MWRSASLAARGAQLQAIEDRVGERVEIVGPWVLLVRTRLEPARWLSLGNWLTAFHQHIPEVVYSAYPPR